MRSAIDRRELGAIFVGGAAGSLVRVALITVYPSSPASWPWATFAINISGAVLLGYLVTRLQERLPLSTYRRPLWGTGFCGAYTTFSTMQLELLQMSITAATRSRPVMPGQASPSGSSPCSPRPR